MDLESLYRWIVAYGTYLAQIFLIVAAALMLHRRRGPGEIVCLLGFVVYLLGALMLRETQGEVLQIGRFSFGSADRQWQHAGQALSALGFAAGAGALMLIKLFRR
jgi:hypothetical protein